MTSPAVPPASVPVPPTSVPVLKRILAWGSLVAAVIAIVGAVLGGVYAGSTGVVSALIGTAMALVFTGITAASIVIANRFAGSELYVGAFFGIVMGGWLLKFIVFLILIVVLRDQPWLNPLVLFLSIVAGVIGSLVVDVVVVMKSRVTYASDVMLPQVPHDQ